MKILFVILLLTVTVFAQSETLFNSDIIEMSVTGLGKSLIIQKITTTSGKYDVSVKGLIELKKANVDEEIIQIMMEKAKVQPEFAKEIPLSQTVQPSNTNQKTLTPKELLLSAKTIVITKNSINPSIQAVEKELLNRKEWKNINVAITEDKSNADLSIQISFVHLSLVTHRYTFRVFDRRTGMLIAAGETTSWGSLSKNLARNIAKALDNVLKSS